MNHDLPQSDATIVLAGIEGSATCYIIFIGWYLKKAMNVVHLVALIGTVFLYWNFVLQKNPC